MKFLVLWHLDVGRHGGAWIYNVKSHEELDLPLPDMSDPAAALGKAR
jgi:hypothetical protein